MTFLYQCTFLVKAIYIYIYIHEGNIPSFNCVHVNQHFHAHPCILAHTYRNKHIQLVMLVCVHVIMRIGTRMLCLLYGYFLCTSNSKQFIMSIYIAYPLARWVSGCCFGRRIDGLIELLRVSYICEIFGCYSSLYANFYE